MYLTEVLMPLAGTQTENVQTIIGYMGEHLRGPLVTRSVMGLTVEKKKSFKIHPEINQDSNPPLQ